MPTKRQKTGRKGGKRKTELPEVEYCNVCGEPLETHTRCEGCGILVGTGHMETSLIMFRCHLICGHCVARWKKIEEMRGHSVDWDAFVSDFTPNKAKEVSHAG